VDHHFSASEKGELVHAIDGVVRAVIPAESFESYGEEYPACLPVLAAITGRAPAPAQTVFVGDEATKKVIELAKKAAKKTAAKKKKK